jgi:hypothetical protein
MSFVSIAVSKDFISVMSDGRVNNEGGILQEDYNKIRELGNGKAFITITGSRDLGERAINVMEEHYNEEVPLAGLAIGLQTVLTRDIPYPAYPLLNMAIGSFSDGRLEVFTLSNRYSSTNEVVRYSPKNEAIDFIKFESPELKGQHNLTEKFIGFLSNTNPSIPLKTRVKQAQRRLNHFVATNDNSVNTRIFHLLIKRF